MAYKIVRKEMLNPTVFLMEVEAPLIARKAEPGQFIILRIDEYGERVPFTIEGYDREKGTITIIVQIVGKTTKDLGAMEAGEYLSDFAGPLGKPTPLDGNKKYAVIGGGLGTAIAYPQAKKLNELGADVTVITGFRNKELIILEDELKKIATKLIVATDDGSNGTKGFVTDMLEKEILAGEKFDEVIAIGPLVMMKFVCKLTEKYNIPTMVSMNPVMIDGTGMCGGCRITVDGETKFACVDGPDFDGHLIDFDEAMTRASAYADFEKREREAACKLYQGVQ